MRWFSQVYSEVGENKWLKNSQLFCHSILSNFGDIGGCYINNIMQLPHTANFNNIVNYLSVILMLFSIEQQQQLNVFSQSDIKDFLYLLLATLGMHWFFIQFNSVYNDVYTNVRNNFLMTGLIIIVLLQININYNKYNDLCQQCLSQWHSLAFFKQCIVVHATLAQPLLIKGVYH